MKLQPVCQRQSRIWRFLPFSLRTLKTGVCGCVTVLVLFALHNVGPMWSELSRFGYCQAFLRSVRIIPPFPLLHATRGRNGGGRVSGLRFPSDVWAELSREKEVQPRWPCWLRPAPPPRWFLVRCYKGAACQLALLFSAPGAASSSRLLSGRFTSAAAGAPSRPWCWTPSLGSWLTRGWCWPAPLRAGRRFSPMWWVCRASPSNAWRIQGCSLSGVAIDRLTGKLPASCRQVGCLAGEVGWCWVFHLPCSCWERKSFLEWPSSKFSLSCRPLTCLLLVVYWGWAVCPSGGENAIEQKPASWNLVNSSFVTSRAFLPLPYQFSGVRPVTIMACFWICAKCLHN